MSCLTLSSSTVMLGMREGFDYDSVKGLRAESLQKLKHHRPETLGQALRISGVTPVDVQLISVILSRYEH